jgi:hypothetical protein
VEEQITRAIEAIILNDYSSYLEVLAHKSPKMILNEIYQVHVGESRQIDSCPYVAIISPGWNKHSDDLIYCPNQDIIDLYNFTLEVHLEGDDPTELEYRAMRYREAFKSCFRNNSTLNSTARGCIISGGDNYNSILGEQAIELIFKMNLDVYGSDQDSTLTF